MTPVHWPLFGLEVRTPRLTLRYPDDQLVDALAGLAAQGIHDRATMPFVEPWTDGEPPFLQRGAMQWHWRCRAEWRPEAWQCPFAVVVDGEPVGVQDLFAKDFAALREVETGSWLVARRQGEGIGTEMREAVLHLAFAGLGASYALSGAWHDNAASLAVSRRLGYAEAGRRRALRRGEPDWLVGLRLDRATWERTRRSDIEVAGLERCRDLFGVS